ncbi:unnamed protein product, partial [Hapterophycus canaliculatus]
MTKAQREAVEKYKASSSSASAAGVVPDEVATSVSDAAVQSHEHQLESLLKESNFRPRKLRKEKKKKLVEAITAMEASFPEDANPVDDPFLSGQWTLVYSSNSRV